MKLCLVGLENLPVLAREYNRHGIGGEQVQQTLLARALQRRGHAVSMVSGDYGQADGAAWHGVPVYKAFRAEAGLPVLRFIHPRWTGLWRALARADAEVYYTSCAGMHVGLMALFCRARGRGLVFRLAHDTDADPARLLIRYTRDKKLYAYGLRRSHAVLSQHGGQQRMLATHYGVPSTVADMLVEPPGQELPLAARDIPVLWVNNLRDFKRPDLALELARLLPQPAAQPGTQPVMHMVGGPQPGFAALYQSIAEQAACVPHLRFHGRVPYHDVGELYDRARVFVNTSDTEGFPNSYLQSWRRGVPVVAFFDPDGLIAREGLGHIATSMPDMVQAVTRLLQDDAHWHAVSARCRAYMAQHHDDDVVLQPYLRAFEHAHQARRGT